MAGTLQLLQLLPLLSSNYSNSPVVANFRLEKTFFESAAGEVKSIIDYEVPRIQIQQFSHSGFGYSYHTRWIKVLGVRMPRIDFSISEQGFRWQTEVGGELRVGASLVAKVLFFQKTGEAYVRAKKLHADLNATILNVGDRPQIKLRDCQINLNSVDVEIDAGLTGFIISLFSDWIEKKIRRVVPDEACKIMEQYIKKVNKLVMEQPENIPVWDNITVNYRLHANPIFRTDAVELTSSFGIYSSTVDDDYDDDKLPSFDFKEHASLFSLPSEELYVIDLLFVLAACIGLTALILDRNYGILIVLGCVLILSLILLLIF